MSGTLKHSVPRGRGKKRQRETQQRPGTDDILGAGKPSSASSEAAAAADLEWRMRSASAAGRRTTAPLTPVVALDCEMVGVGPNSEISILAQVCVVNFHGRVVYCTYVRPTDEVSGELPLAPRHVPRPRLCLQRLAKLSSVSPAHTRFSPD